MRAESGLNKALISCGLPPMREVSSLYLSQSNQNGVTPLMVVLRYNTSKNINLDWHTLELMIKTSNLKQVNNKKMSPLMYALQFNKTQNLNLPFNLIEYMVKNSDLMHFDHEGWTPLMYVLKYNQEQNLNISNYLLRDIVRNSDLNQVNKDGWSPLMFLLRNNKEQHINIQPTLMKEIVRGSNLNQTDKDGWLPLMYIARFNKDQEINIDKELLEAIIKVSDLKQVSSENWNTLLFLISCNKKQNLNISSELFEYLIENSDINKQVLSFLIENVEQIDSVLTPDMFTAILAKTTDIYTENNNGFILDKILKKIYETGFNFGSDNIDILFKTLNEFQQLKYKDRFEQALKMLEKTSTDFGKLDAIEKNTQNIKNFNDILLSLEADRNITKEKLNLLHGLIVKLIEAVDGIKMELVVNKELPKISSGYEDEDIGFEKYHKPITEDSLAYFLKKKSND